jgi:hypothetical protein
MDPVELAARNLGKISGACHPNNVIGSLERTSLHNPKYKHLKNWEVKA